MVDIAIDEKLAYLAAILWRPLEAETDKKSPSPSITAQGKLRFVAMPLEGPETDNERFFTMVWQAAKPSRWFTEEDWKPLVLVTESGRLVGDIGFGFEFVGSDDEADGKTKFVVGWGME